MYIRFDNQQFFRILKHFNTWIGIVDRSQISNISEKNWSTTTPNCLKAFLSNAVTYHIYIDLVRFWGDFLHAKSHQGIFCKKTGIFCKKRGFFVKIDEFLYPLLQFFPDFYKKSPGDFLHDKKSPQKRTRSISVALFSSSHS